MSDVVIPPPPAPSPTEPSSTSAPRRRGLVIGAAVTAVLVLAGAVAFVATQGDEAKAGPLALSFAAGDTHRYRVEQSMDLTVGGEAIGGTEDLRLEIEQLVSWTVTDVDDDGVATIRVEVEDVSGSVNGTPAPPSGPIPPVDLRISPDGEVVSIGGPALGGAGIDLSQGGFGQLFDVPGSNQVTPLLPPDGDATPGDTWDSSYHHDVPFGEGSVDLEATSRYDRDERVDGAETAVIVTDSDVRMDVAFAFADLIEMFGGGAMPTGASGVEALADASMTYAGTASSSQTGWLDLASRELVRMRSTGELDLEMEIVGVPAASGTITVAGTYTQEMARA
jgi:hypothetical protein